MMFTTVNPASVGRDEVNMRALSKMMKIIIYSFRYLHSLFYVLVPPSFPRKNTKSGPDRIVMTPCWTKNP